MVNKITKRAILKIKETVDAYGKEMVAVSEKIATIDEKYRKLAEKETKELKAAYANLEAEQEIWNSSLSRYDADVVNEVLGESFDSNSTADEMPEQTVESDSTAEEEEGTIVDTLFEDNNASAEEETLELAAEESLVEDDLPEGTLKEDVVDIPEEEAQEETTEEAPVEFPEDNIEDTVEESDINTDDGWPEFPEEWNN